MSEVAVRLAVANAMYFMFKTTGGSGLLMNGTPGTERAKVTVIGGGVARTAAANMAASIGCYVTLIEFNENRIWQLYHLFGKQVHILKSNHANIEKSVLASDFVISTVLIPGASAPKLVTEEMVKKMKKKKKIVLLLMLLLTKVVVLKQLLRQQPMIIQLSLCMMSFITQ